jgi:hypothetical protein
MMCALLEAFARLIAVFRRHRLDREFEEELAALVDLLAERNEGRGLPPVDA